jgi:4-amino-4-deoxy-L-arabinose transferase-like glycosyltransferase
VLALLLAILAAAALLRLPRLASLPPGVIPDEAMGAYDAFSIVRTGRDQQGVWLPLFPRSTAGLHSLYQFLAVPSVALLGLGELATRLPAALAGVLTVALTFLLVRRDHGCNAGLFAAALLAVSPWHTLTSRTGHEWVLLPLLAVAAVWLAARALAGQGSWLAAGLAAGAAPYTYTPLRLSLPLVYLGLALTRPRQVIAQRPGLARGVALAALVAAPAMAFALSEQGLSRLGVVGIQAGTRTEFVAEFARRYAASFWPAFSFSGAREPELHRLRSTGLLYAFEAPLIVLGALRALKQRRPDGLLFLCWLLAAPLSVSIHKDAPDPILNLTSLPAPQALGGIGAAAVLELVRRAGRMRVPLLGAAALAVAIPVARMTLDLYRDFPVYAAPAWGHGVREAVAEAEARRLAYDDVVVDGSEKLIFSLILFYTRYDPLARQRDEAALTGRGYRSRVGPYRIGSVAELSATAGRHLVWTSPRAARELFPGREALSVVRWPDGRPHYVLLEVEGRVSR